MVQKPRAVKLKVIVGYILLFSFAVISVWFIYTEILKIALPDNNNDDNKKIIQISNTIADLYASEALGRTSILTGAPEDHFRYNKTLDSIEQSLEIIKEAAEPAQKNKFDSIQLLLELKRKSTSDIIEYRKTSGSIDAFGEGISGIYNAKDSIKKRVKPVKIEKNYQWTNLVNSLLTPQQMDSLSKLSVSNDSLAMAFDKVLSNLWYKDKRLKYELYRREQKLLEENLVISDQLRALLSSVENEILNNSYLKISKSQEGIGRTIDTMAWMGAIGFIILLISASIIINDLNKHQTYRKQLELLNAENERLLRIKTMLMATVTHDLQTPLGSIIGFSDLMDSSDISDKQKQYVGNIKDSADYILRLVNDLLDFSKLENNRITIEEVSFNVKSLIENTCMTLEPAASNKGIELTWDIDEELNSNFISDPFRLKQVLTNLISNSIKFTPEGSVEVTATNKEGLITIAVLDTGIGIAQEKQADVFKEFTQAHPGIEKRFGGTGLGLTISKKIIELLGGNITLESQEDQGSIFTISIPCKPCTSTLVSDTASEVCNEYPSLIGKKLLVIDDDLTQLALMREIFTGYGMRVKIEANSSNISTLINEESFDMILTDIQMPAMDGFEVVSIIRSHVDSTISAMPVIALSGRKDLENSDYLNAGFTASHSKPVELHVLAAIMENIFGGSVTIQQNQKKAGSQKSLFSLKSLSQFTQNDPHSLQLILETFIESAAENCKALKEAVVIKDEQKIASVAHKMIPMLRQMEVYSIVKLLDPLEDRKINGDWIRVEEQVYLVCDRMNELINKLKEVTA